MPGPIPEPPRAEEVLAAARYPAGATVTLSRIVEVGGVNESTAGQICRWARSVGRWANVGGKREPRAVESGRAARRG